MKALLFVIVCLVSLSNAEAKTFCRVSGEVESFYKEVGGSVQFNSAVNNGKILCGTSSNYLYRVYGKGAQTYTVSVKFDGVVVSEVDGALPADGFNAGTRATPPCLCD